MGEIKKNRLHDQILHHEACCFLSHTDTNNGFFSCSQNVLFKNKLLEVPEYAAINVTTMCMSFNATNEQFTRESLSKIKFCQIYAILLWASFHTVIKYLIDYTEQNRKFTLTFISNTLCKNKSYQINGCAIRSRSV